MDGTGIDVADGLGRGEGIVVVSVQTAAVAESEPSITRLSATTIGKPVNFECRVRPAPSASRCQRLRLPSASDVVRRPDPTTTSCFPASTSRPRTAPPGVERL